MVSNDNKPPNANQQAWRANTVVENIAPSANRSCSSSLNGSDPEQISEQQKVKTFPNVVNTWNNALMMNLCTYRTYQINKNIKATRTLFTHPY